MQPFRFWAWSALILLATAGCDGGSSDGLPREAVTGKVTIDGQSLNEGTITLVPIDFDGPVAGEVIRDGSYSVDRAEGPVPGPYRVSIYSRKKTGKQSPDPDDPEVIIEETFERIPPRYNLKSELKADIKEGGGNSFDYQLEGEIKTPPPSTPAKRGRR